MSTIAVNTITDASGGTTAMINGYTPTVSNMAGRNRIINGAMMIDQRNAGASVTPASGDYTLDRWQCFSSASSKYSIQQNSAAPAGFTNSLKVTSLASTSVGSGDYYFIDQKIEGYNVADLGFGTANASTVTLSFRVRSSLTGTFGGAVLNSGSNRSYPFTYTISAADTWETKTITLAGDTTGTWLTTNGNGLYITWSLGMGSTYSGTANAWAGSQYWSATGATSVVGTNGATFYITGVQLEAGSVATPFEHRQYGTELALCQRYYEKIGAIATNEWGIFASASASGHAIGNTYTFSVPKRAIPTMAVVGTFYVSGFNTVTTGSISGTGTNSFWPTPITSTSGNVVAASGTSAYWTASAEL